MVLHQLFGGRWRLQVNNSPPHLTSSASLVMAKYKGRFIVPDKPYSILLGARSNCEDDPWQVQLAASVTLSISSKKRSLDQVDNGPSSSLLMGMAVEEPYPAIRIGGTVYAVLLHDGNADSFVNLVGYEHLGGYYLQIRTGQIGAATNATTFEEKIYQWLEELTTDFEGLFQRYTGTPWTLRSHLSTKLPQTTFSPVEYGTG
eukprot:TRINITY_DN9848_c0_g1_i2.p1 TRINITY_DN9848_c0_g1~~TRINITY_DN9848_c0_g1_i2.p1  ORF type:complete len:202 (-),score=15.21 TRINITY_DN9848_c0_g1_i2:102-707(-)